MQYGNTQVLETSWKQRAYDGKHMLLGKVWDEDQKYTYESETGHTVTLVPTKWVILAVYDYLLEIME